MPNKKIKTKASKKIARKKAATTKTNTTNNSEQKFVMFWVKMFATKQDSVLAVCDEELIEKELMMRYENEKGKKDFFIRFSSDDQ